MLNSFFQRLGWSLKVTYVVDMQDQEAMDKAQMALGLELLREKLQP